MAKSTYPTRVLGNSGVAVSAIGFGAMGMSAFYGGGKSEDSEYFNVFDHALKLGCTFWDTADTYGPYTNEELLGRYFAQSGRRDEVFLATKFGNIILPDGTRNVRGDAAYVHEACDLSLRRLQIETIDLYFAHRIDPKVPIEETVGAMAELVKQGKVRYIGLSECSADTLRRANAVHPIAAIQMEYSPFALDIERPETGPLLSVCKELNVALICYSPLGRGFLTGAFRNRADFEPGDWRLSAPRFSEENFPQNLAVVEKLKAIADNKHVSVAQLCLAWLLAQGEMVIPIPGTKKIKYLEENLGAVHVNLTDAEQQKIRAIVDSGEVKGERYPEAILRVCFGDTPPLSTKK